jgi:hypothetical protein
LRSRHKAAASDDDFIADLVGPREIHMISLIEHD